MLEKRVIVYLDTGATREHVLLVEDDDAYAKKYNEFSNLLIRDSGLLAFGTPLCIYKIKNIIAIEFVDPPPPSVPMGYIKAKEEGD